MLRVKVLENDFITMWHYPEKGIIHHQFLRAIGGESFQTTLNTGYRILKAKSATKWLSDDRANSIFLPEDSAWAQDVWLPLMVKAGWKYWALILPENRLGQINMEWQVKAVAARGVTVKFFSDPEKGMEWLEQQVS